MRCHGTLVKWNGERGFGFIAPASGAEELFVHVSAFPRDGRPPRLQEVLSYEVETAPDGRRRAVAIQRTGQARAVARTRPSRRPAPSGKPSPWPRMLAGAAVLALALAYGWPKLQGLAGPAGAALRQGGTAPPSAGPAAGSAEKSPYRCDGRTRCPQMRSCAEATWVLQHCPGTQMDGDGDGIPCERQWCGD